MRAVCQRVSEARVRVHGAITGEIGIGLAVLLGIARGDSPTDVDRLATKVSRLRIFGDDRGKFDRSLLDVEGEALVVTRKGNRPSFVDAAPPAEAEPLYERFCSSLRSEGIPVATGVFGAIMAVELVHDGPVTIVLESGSNA